MTASISATWGVRTTLLLFAALLFGFRIAHGQEFASGDTLYLRFHDKPRVPHYIRGPGEKAIFAGYLKRDQAVGDTAFVVESWGRWYYDIMLGDSSLGLIDSDIAAIAVNPEQIREEERKRQELERIWQEQVARMQLLEDKGIPVVLNGFSFGVNSAGGVEPYIELTNISDNRIKYIVMQLAPFNPVGDPAYDEFTGGTTHTLKLIGPIEPGEAAVYDYGGNPAFYAEMTDCIEVRQMEVEYMGGGKFLMIRDLELARRNEMAYRIKGECRVQ